MDPTTQRMMSGSAGGGPPPPEIVSFTGTGYHIYGGTAYIDFSWQTNNADTCSISPDVGTLPSTTGITTHYPGNPGYPSGYSYNQTYTLTASTQSTSVTSSITFSCTIQCTGRELRGKCFGGSYLPNCT